MLQTAIVLKLASASIPESTIGGSHKTTFTLTSFPTTTAARAYGVGWIYNFTKRTHKREGMTGQMIRLNSQAGCRRSAPARLFENPKNILFSSLGFLNISSLFLNKLINKAWGLIFSFRRPFHKEPWKVILTMPLWAVTIEGRGLSELSPFIFASISVKPPNELCKVLFSSSSMLIGVENSVAWKIKRPSYHWKP